MRVRVGAGTDVCVLYFVLAFIFCYLLHFFSFIVAKRGAIIIHLLFYVHMCRQCLFSFILVGHSKLRRYKHTENIQHRAHICYSRWQIQSQFLRFNEWSSFFYMNFEEKKNSHKNTQTHSGSDRDYNNCLVSIIDTEVNTHL